MRKTGLRNSDANGARSIGTSHGRTGMEIIKLLLDLAQGTLREPFHYFYFETDAANLRQPNHQQLAGAAS